MHKVQTVLRGAGMDFENVVWMNVYLTDANDQAALEDVYWKMIGSSSSGANGIDRGRSTPWRKG